MSLVFIASRLICSPYNTTNAALVRAAAPNHPHDPLHSARAFAAALLAARRHKPSPSAQHGGGWCGSMAGSGRRARPTRGHPICLQPVLRASKIGELCINGSVCTSCNGEKSTHLKDIYAESTDEVNGPVISLTNVATTNHRVGDDDANGITVNYKAWTNVKISVMTQFVILRTT